MPNKPSEYKLSEKWDVAAENFLVKSGTGLLGGMLAGAILFRTIFSFSPPTPISCPQKSWFPLRLT
eukprot:1392085-Amorphochlora_amoeboformis.AAC.1